MSSPSKESRLKPTTLALLAEERIVRAGVAPGATLAFGVRVGARWTVHAAAAGVRCPCHPTPVAERTPYDLASVTKPFTATALVRLARRRIVSLRTPLGDLVPETKGTPTEAATLELLAAHRAGLEAHLELFAPLRRKEAPCRRRMLEAAAAARRSDCSRTAPRDGFSPVYSDLGYLLLGEALSRAAGQELDVVIEEEVTRPLGLDIASARQWRRRNSAWLRQVAPTESVEWRGGEITGQVHDENAFALAGDGTSGHAGLFGTASAVVRFGAAVVDALAGRRAEWLEPREAVCLTRERPGGTLRAGFDGRSPDGSSAGQRFGSRSFGHLGFTGTSLWCDPDAEVVAVVLTNRVCPSRENVSIRAARPGLHDALFGLAKATSRRDQTP